MAMYYANMIFLYNVSNNICTYILYVLYCITGIIATKFIIDPATLYKGYLQNKFEKIEIVSYSRFICNCLCIDIFRIN